MPDVLCTVEGCTNAPRNWGASLCSKHYHRQYRHGDVTITAQASGVSVRKPRRYRTVSMRNHPLAMANGRVYLHRMILFDALDGKNPHCYWCGAQLDWSKRRGDPACVNVDHLDGDTGNNERSNLEPSCGRCNSTRGVQERSRALRAAGLWSGYDTVATLRSGGRAAAVEVAR